MIKAMSELFNLPLVVVSRPGTPGFSAGIAECGRESFYTAIVYERTGEAADGKERAEAIVAAVNERDALRAEVERLRTALDTVEGMMRRAKRGAGDYDNAAPFLLRRVGDVADYARAVLDAGEGKG